MGLCCDALAAAHPTGGPLTGSNIAPALWDASSDRSSTQTPCTQLTVTSHRPGWSACCTIPLPNTSCRREHSNTALAAGLMPHPADSANTLLFRGSCNKSLGRPRGALHCRPPPHTCLHTMPAAHIVAKSSPLAVTTLHGPTALASSSASQSHRCHNPAPRKQLKNPSCLNARLPTYVQ